MGAPCRPARGRGPDAGDADSGPVVALVGGFDVPDVGLERVAAAADAHFGEVAEGVLGFWEACCWGGGEC